MFKLPELVELLAQSGVSLSNEALFKGASCTVSGVAHDSRLVKPGDIFVCIPGFKQNGAAFAAQAVAAGAVAVVAEEELSTTLAVPCLLVDNARRSLAILAAHIYGYPANSMVNIGITGTNGKTTSAFLTEAVLKEGNFAPGMLGTIEAHVGKEVLHLANTTPESLQLHQLFSQMVASQQSSLVMEVSSHALCLDRTFGIPFDIAVFTNLTQDHLDFHGDMESYFQAKTKLFRSLGTFENRPRGPYAIINIDDPYGVRLVELIKNRVPVLTFGTAPHADVRAYNIQASPTGLSFTLETRLGAREVHLQISGLFNVHNSLAAVAVGLALRMNLDPIVKALESVVAVPGRFQLVGCGQDFTVIVDYAHTPDGLQNLLTSARGITMGKLSVVFGCGGDRDKGKRPQMGKIAVDLADKVYITTDNPRSEDPKAIVDEILAGTEGGTAELQVIYDRAEAIAAAIAAAKTGDTVVIAGKGHETYQIFDDVSVNFDDVAHVKKNLEGRAGHDSIKAALPKIHLKITWDRSAFDKSRYISACAAL